MASKKSLVKSIVADSFDNDATLKLLGYDYQKLIALERCLDAKPNEHIWIECKGDVADEHTSTEVKHHSSQNNLSNNSLDAWKTIKNYVENFHIAQTFSHLILHTTSSVPETSIFYGWNNLTTAKKKKKLFDHSPSESIKEHYDKIKACSPKNLQIILERFSILSDQPKVAEKWGELKAHSSLIVVPDNFRDAAIEQLYGYITKAAIDNSKMWQININDFRRDMQHTLSMFTTGKIPFQFVTKSDIETEFSGLEFKFIRKMKDVQLKNKDQESAVSDYLRAQESQIKMLSSSPTLNEPFNHYDGNVHKVLNEEKSKNSYNLKIEEIGSDKAHKESRDMFFNCLSKHHDQIIGVNDTQKYYRDGRIHHIAEESDFEWQYREADL